jgi:hypothetical protein
MDYTEIWCQLIRGDAILYWFCEFLSLIKIKNKLNFFGLWIFVFIMLVEELGGGGVWATKVTSAGLTHSCDPCYFGSTLLTYPGMFNHSLKKAFKKTREKALQQCNNIATSAAAMLMNSKLNHF